MCVSVYMCVCLTVECMCTWRRIMSVCVFGCSMLYLVYFGISCVCVCVAGCLGICLGGICICVFGSVCLYVCAFWVWYGVFVCVCNTSCWVIVHQAYSWGHIYP